MDYLKYGKTQIHFQHPPGIDLKLDHKIYADGLKESIPKKLKELLDRIEVIGKESEEFEYIEKWIKYWLLLLDNLKPKLTSFQMTQGLDKDRAKQFPIENLYTGQLRKFGGKLSGKCPFHSKGDERTPSFFIYPDNHWWCFSCSEGGDVINYLMKLKGYEFKEALRNLT